MSGKQSDMHDNQERLTEALSAYLDGALAAAEREALERHLATCATCQSELADLRRVRALLRALPQPVAPRSFALPETPAPARRISAPRHAPAWTRAAQWAGGIAAAVGVGLLTLGALHSPSMTAGALSSERNVTSSYGGSTSAPAPSKAPSTDQANSSPSAARTPTGEGTSPATGATTTVTVATPTTATANTGTQTPPPVSVPGTESTEPPLLPAGATLLIGGGVALVVGAASRRRARRRSVSRS